MTFLFIDMVRFTSVAEMLPLTRLRTFVNAFLACASDEIEKHHGSVDKFTGDGLVAFWNAPRLDPDHAFHACKAALAVDRQLAGTLAPELVCHGLPPIAVRMGIHSGEALVGNVGSSLRMDYTALGDALNVTARLEGLNRVFGTVILVSKPIADAVRGRMLLRPLGLCHLKHRIEPVHVSELLGAVGEERPAQEVALQRTLFSLLSDGRWGEAAAHALTMRRDFRAHSLG